jgi:hypothetical protein
MNYLMGKLEKYLNPSVPIDELPRGRRLRPRR